MLLGIISDTHDRLEAAEEAVKVFTRRKAGAVIHAGDMVAPFTAQVFARAPMPVYAVYGNNDGETQGLARILPGIVQGLRVVELNGLSIGVIHDMNTLDAAQTQGLNVLVHGHTHRVEINPRDGLLVLNPGEACGLLSGRPTVLLLDTDELATEIVELCIP
jgi:putative phosphoesterase